MTKALRTFTVSERYAVANKRVKNATKGLGYWGAIDYLARTSQVQKKEKNNTE